MPKTMQFTGDRTRHEARAESMIGRNVRVNGMWRKGTGRALTWRWWIDTSLRAEVLQVAVSFPGDSAIYHIDLDFIRLA